MKKSGTGFLATTDSRRASVRPMSACAWFGSELWMATGAKSAKSADLRRRPRAEICYMLPDFRNVRISGACRLSKRPADKKKMFSAFRWMKLYFESPASPGWIVVRMKPESIRLMASSAMTYREVLRRKKAR
jgi:general stress protein 26